MLKLKKQFMSKLNTKNTNKDVKVNSFFKFIIKESLFFICKNLFIFDKRISYIFTERKENLIKEIKKSLHLKFFNFFALNNYDLFAKILIYFLNFLENDFVFKNNYKTYSYKVLLKKYKKLNLK
jgi:hypothetical protein